MCIVIFLYKKHHDVFGKIFPKTSWCFCRLFSILCMKLINFLRAVYKARNNLLFTQRRNPK